jgi:hypothetical protein
MMTSEEKVNTIDEYFKKNNKALHTYRNNSAARSLGADIESIDIDKIDTDELKKEMEKELIESLKKLDKESEKIREQNKTSNSKKIKDDVYVDTNAKGEKEKPEEKKDPTKTDF